MAGLGRLRPAGPYRLQRRAAVAERQLLDQPGVLVVRGQHTAAAEGLQEGTAEDRQAGGNAARRTADETRRGRLLDGGFQLGVYRQRERKQRRQQRGRVELQRRPNQRRRRRSVAQLGLSEGVTRAQRTHHTRNHSAEVSCFFFFFLEFVRTLASTGESSSLPLSKLFTIGHPCPVPPLRTIIHIH